MELTVAKALEMFLLAKQTEGKSPKTIIWYANLLRTFLSFVGDIRLRELTIDHARDFVAGLQSRTTRYDDHPNTPQKEGGLAPRTIHAYVRALKAFGTWVYEEQLVNRNAFERLKRPRLPADVIKVLSEEEIRALVSCINPNTYLGARQYAIVLLLLDTGLRASELCSLTLANTFLDENKIIVKGKGNKERMVGFGSGAKSALIRYLHPWRPEPISEEIDNLFLSVNGSPLTYVGLVQCIRKLGVRSGVPRLHPHLFRHTFAVSYLMNGGDVMSLKSILGHTTLDVTQVYVHLAEQHIQIQQRKYSPVDRLGIGRERRRWGRTTAQAKGHV